MMGEIREIRTENRERGRNILLQEVHALKLRRKVKI